MKRILFYCCLLLGANAVAQPFQPDFVLKRDRYTNLLVFDGERSPGIEPNTYGQKISHLKYWAENWNKTSQFVCWNVISKAKEHYDVNVLCNANLSEVILEVGLNGHWVSNRMLKSDTAEFLRVQLNGELFLRKGVNKLTLKIRPAHNRDTFNVSVHGIELIRPSVKNQYDEQVKTFQRERDTRWFRQCRYGLFLTWTSQVYPRTGERKNYDDAVSAFDIDGFVRQVVRTGAGLVVFNTSHAEMYFPAPIKALDNILPGRTTKRDLIADLSRALASRGIKLFIYYHLGAVSDSVWTRASGFWNTDANSFFERWRSVIGEIGIRYGNAISGFWFDDGAMNYYYRSPDWLSLYRAAKTGNPQRLVGFNSWKLPPPTQFMDYYVGEANLDPSMHGELKKGGDGIILKGPYKGLQASSTFVTESDDWGHFVKDKPIIPFRFSAEQLAVMLKKFETYGNVPLLNMEIYQNGLMSESSVAVFEKANILNKQN